MTKSQPGIACALTHGFNWDKWTSHIACRAPLIALYQFGARLETSAMPLTSTQIRKGVRVVFSGPPPGEIVPMFNREGHHLMERAGTSVYGISEDVWCYPDNPQRDSVWVAFDGDKPERRQVAIAWLEEAEGWQ